MTFWGKPKQKPADKKPESESIDSMVSMIKPLVFILGKEKIKSIIGFIPTLFDKIIKPESKEAYVIHRVGGVLMIAHYSETGELISAKVAKEFLDEKIGAGLEELLK